VIKLLLLPPRARALKDDEPATRADEVYWRGAETEEGAAAGAAGELESDDGMPATGVTIAPAESAATAALPTECESGESIDSLLRLR
jgi:hypothetical protein